MVQSIRVEPIPGKDHIARYCPFSKLTEDGRPSGVAFRLKSNEAGKYEEFLSVDWLEILEPHSQESQIAKLREILANFLSLKASAKIAVLNVSGIISQVIEKSPDKRELAIEHRPLEGRLSHSGIFNLLPDDDLIADLIAQVVVKTYPARA